MKKIAPYLILILLIILSSCNNNDTTEVEEQTPYEINEDGTYQDFLTPYYYTTNETDLRDEINKFIHFARIENYQHPFKNPNGDIASYSINRAFGDEIGSGGVSQHHPAIDLYLDNISDNTMYAAHDGIVNTYRDSPKYRHYLTITKSIKDSENNSIGKIVAIYAHIDLDLDESELIQLNGLAINKGDVVSKNLYSGTMGGPHLHFEIRFYKNSDIGNEDFYHFQNTGDYTAQSSGIWSYGYWNTHVGYGYGDPINFGIE